MAITLPTAKHVSAQHAGVTGHGANPSKTSPESGVHSVQVFSDVGELGSLLFGHTVADSVNRTETASTAQQTDLGGFIPRLKAAGTKRTGTFSSAVDPGARNRGNGAAKTNATQFREAAQRQAAKLQARIKALIPRG